MADKTGIEWTDATWNPIAGCTIVSKGCTHCYAMHMAARLEAMRQPKYAGLTKVVNGNTVWTGKIAVAGEPGFRQPLRWKKPRRIFVNSMSDLFHDDVDAETINRIMAIMVLTPQHTYQVLTKRPATMRAYLTGWYQKHGFAPLPNVWLGVSVEDQATANERIPLLLNTPAAVRWISAEPLLGPVLLPGLDGPIGATVLDWVVVGGESGPDARPMHPDWARDIRDDCKAAGTPFFFKQWGEWAPGENSTRNQVRTERTARWWDGKWSFGTITPKVSEEMHVDDEPDLYRFGKQVAAALLDGREHREYPR